MGDDKLMTLKEIAKEIGVNYKTLHGYREVFEDFLVVKLQGRRVKYKPVNIKIFSKILELKDEGQSNTEIYENLKVWSSENLEILKSGCLSVGLSVGLSDCLDVCPSVSPSVCRSVCPSVGLDVGLSEDQNESSANNSEDSPADDKLEESLSSEHDDFLTEQEKLDNQLSEFKDGLLIEISAQVDQQLEEKINYEFLTLAGKLENHLSELQAQINGSLTQFYKAILNIHEGLMSLNNRLSALEADLDTGSDQGIELYEIDLDDVQIKNPEINFSKDYTENNPMSAGQEQGNQNDDSPGREQEQGEPQIENTSRHADIEYVKNSIFEGKPDRAAVIEWIKNEKFQDPGQSYGDLANKLNEAGIPTLRGRDHWCRTTVRGLVVKR